MLCNNRKLTLINRALIRPLSIKERMIKLGNNRWVINKSIYKVYKIIYNNIREVIQMIDKDTNIIFKCTEKEKEEIKKKAKEWGMTMSAYIRFKTLELDKK